MILSILQQTILCGYAKGQNDRGTYGYPDNKLGDLKSDSLGECQTRIVEGTNSSSDYIMQYTEHRQKVDSKGLFK
ncbi:MAG: hypothetical protein ACTHMI_10915 [Mucilaginibacter sp.]